MKDQRSTSCFSCKRKQFNEEDDLFGAIFLLGSAIDGQINEAVAVAPLVVVPRDDLVEVFVQRDAGTGVDDGGARVVHKVLRDDRRLGVAEDALQGSFGGRLQFGVDLVLARCLSGANGQIDHGNIRRGDADCHTGELPVELGDDLSDGLGGTGRRRDQVVDGRTSSAPILAAFGGSVDRELVGSGRVDGGHETFDDAELVVDDLGQGSEAVGRAGRIRQDGLARVGGVVDTHDKHGRVGRRRRDDDALGTALQVGLGLFDGGEDTGGFANGFGAKFTPRDI